MTSYDFIVLGGGLAFGILSAAYARWSRWRLERKNHDRPAD